MENISPLTLALVQHSEKEYSVGVRQPKVETQLFLVIPVTLGKLLNNCTFQFPGCKTDHLKLFGKLNNIKYVCINGCGK